MRPQTHTGIATVRGRLPLSPREFEAHLVALDREQIKRKGFYKFVQLAWEHIPINANIPFVPAKHIEQMCLHAEAMIPGSRLCPDHKEPPLIRELVCNIPPGYTKTMVWLILLNAWIWTFRPDYRFLAASFDHGLSIQSATLTRDLVRSEWYVKRWGNILDPAKSRMAGNFWTKKGGFRFSTSIGGKGTGRHGHGFFVDDPIKPMAADSARSGDELSAEVQRANAWLQGVMASRTVDAKTYVKAIIMQRINEDDPSQYGIDNGWVHLCLPAKYERARHCVTPIGGDWRTCEGEMLEPSRFPADAEDRRAAGMGGWEGAVANAQLQQRPAPPGGLIFKRARMGSFYASANPIRTTYSAISIDCNFKSRDTTSDVGITIAGLANGKLRMYEAMSKNLGFIGTIKLLRELMTEWRADAILIEDKANGPAVIELLQEHFPNVIAIDPKTSKESRAHAANVYYEANSVLHNVEMVGMRDVKADGTSITGLEAFENVLSTYPRGKGKDVVDSMSQLLLWLAQQVNGHRDKAFKKLGEEGAAIEALLGLQGSGMLGDFSTHFRVGR